MRALRNGEWAPSRPSLFSGSPRAFFIRIPVWPLHSIKLNYGRDRGYANL